MQAITYPWQRLWVSDAEAPLDNSLDYNGYFRAGSQARPLVDWQETPCLILLGEPGMGKSWEWKQSKHSQANKLHCFINLGDYSSATLLLDRIERNAAVRQWLTQTETILWLWLDSFDEGLLHERKLAQALRDLIEQWPRERLRFRVLSRTATWPEFFTQDLQALFPEQPNRPGIHKLHLAPLTLVQVQDASEVEGIDSSRFFTAVEEADAVAMAMRPVTLRLLFGLWKAGVFGGAKRMNRGELFAAGCRHLCEEAWDDQRTPPPGYDPELRMRVAAHLALLMVFGNRQALLFHEPGRQRSERELLLREVVGNTTIPGTKPSVLLDRPLVEQVLRHTGLFAPNPQQAFWAHQAYADFLAAWALYDARVPVPQLRNLFRSPVAGAGVVPALRDTAVWLASLSPTFAAALIEMDALTAIRADGLTATDQQRAQMVDDLFTLTRDRHFYPYRAEPYLGQLKYPGLADRLREPLVNTITSPEARRLVNYLIESCSLRDLAPLLIQQVLDATVPFAIRSQALRLLKGFVDDEIRQQLRPLIKAIPIDDDNDDFRGILLQLLWPSHLSARELTSLLTPSRQSTHLGAYHRFLEPELSGTLQTHLSLPHLPTMLCWVLRHATRYSGSDDDVFKIVVRIVLSVAWQHTDDTQVVKWLTPALKQFWVRYYATIPQEAAPRNRILHHMVEYNILPEPIELVSGYNGNNAKSQALVDLNDWTLLLELATQTGDFSSKEILLTAAMYLINRQFRVNDLKWQCGFSEVYKITTTAKCEISLNEQWVTHLDSSSAKSSCEFYALNKEIREEKQTKARKSRRLNSRTFRLLTFLTSSSRTDIFRSWWRIHFLLSRGLNRKETAVLTDVRQQFRWCRSYTLLEQRVVLLAQQVVTTKPPSPGTRYEINKLSRLNTVYLAALITTKREKPALLASFSAEDWQPWVRLLLFVGNWATKGSREQLLSVALHQHRRTTISHILAQQDFWEQVFNDKYGYSHLNDLLRESTDKLLMHLALQHVIAFTWRHQFTQEVFRQLLELQCRSTELFRDALLAQNTAGPELHRLTFVAISITLFELEPTIHWWYYWQQAIGFGSALMRPLLKSVGEWRRPLHAAGISLLTDAQLTQILNWLVDNLGAIEENGPDDWHRDEPDMRIRAFRNNVAKLLASRATAEAWETLQQLSVRLNYPRWLVYLLEEVRETYSRVEWSPLPVADLLALCRNASQRWVHGGEDLLDALIESLDRYQGRMQGEPARAHLLWYPVNELKGNRIRNGKKVREENEVTDDLQSFLTIDLPQYIFSAKREVQIRASSGTQRGQELDLYIDAVARDVYGKAMLTDRISVFIEAKHNDNREVTTALQKQLANRYLQNHSAKHGLFIVYWHTAETRKSLGRGSIDELRLELARQAQEASKDGLVIRSYVLDIRLPDDL